MKRLLAVLLLTTPAAAHDVWANGEAVPEWVKSACCGPEDVHHLTDDQVHITSQGYKVDGYPDIIPFERALPSPDGTPWIFYKKYGGAFSSVYCFFIGVKGT